MRSVELQHNCLLGFLNSREEAIEALPKLMSDSVSASLEPLDLRVSPRLASAPRAHREVDGSSLPSAVVVDGEAIEFDIAALTLSLHLDVERAHACLQDLQQSQVSLHYTM